MNRETTELELTIIIGNYLNGDKEYAMLRMRNLNKLDTLLLAYKWIEITNGDAKDIIRTISKTID